MVTSSTKSQVIDIDAPAIPAVLSGLLGISVPMVYQGRQDGKLPTNPQASYRECVHHYTQWYKRKSTAKSSNMLEKKLEQDIKLGFAKEELHWLEIKKAREQLIEKTLLAAIIVPVFQLVRSGLVNITREYPDTREKIDNMLRSWEGLGTRLKEEVSIDADMYIQDKLDAEVTLTTIDNSEDFDEFN